LFALVQGQRARQGRSGYHDAMSYNSEDSWLDEEEDFESPSEEDIQRFSDVTTICPECHSEIYDDTEICPICGYNLSQARHRPSAFQIWVIVILVLILSGGLLIALESWFRILT